MAGKPDGSLFEGSVMNEATRTPLGIEPGWVWKRKRIFDLHATIGRHLEADNPARVGEWAQELAELVDWERARIARRDAAGWCLSVSTTNDRVLKFVRQAHMECGKRNGWTREGEESRWLSQKVYTTEGLAGMRPDVLFRAIDLAATEPRPATCSKGGRP